MLFLVLFNDSYFFLNLDVSVEEFAKSVTQTFGKKVCVNFVIYSSTFMSLYFILFIYNIYCFLYYLFSRKWKREQHGIQLTQSILWYSLSQSIFLSQMLHIIFLIWKDFTTWSWLTRWPLDNLVTGLYPPWVAVCDTVCQCVASLQQKVCWRRKKCG